MIILLLLFLPLASALLRAPQPVLQTATNGGSGCPVGTLIQAKLLPLNTTTNDYPLVHSLSSITPSYGPFIPITEMRKNCAVYLNITVSPEWLIRVHQKGTWVQGFARLADSSTRLLWRGGHTYYEAMHRVRSAFCFPSLPFVLFLVDVLKILKNSSSLEIQGPFDGYFRQFAPTSESEYPWVESPCGGGTLTINHQLRIVSGTAKELAWIGEPEEDTVWTFTTDVQVLKCMTK